MRQNALPSSGDVGYATGVNHEHITSNRLGFLTSTGFDPASLTLGQQVHGNQIAVVSPDQRGLGQPPVFDAIPATDGLITAAPEITLGMIVADCVPLLLYDASQHALGLVHAGWRGTVAEIARAAVEMMQRDFGSQPENLLAGIGPSIGPCCYEVGYEVIEAWSETGVDHWKSAYRKCSGRFHFDLWKANELTLEKSGVPTNQMESARICTWCAGDSFFSHRAAMAGERTRGRMIMVAQLEA